MAVLQKVDGLRRQYLFYSTSLHSKHTPLSMVRNSSWIIERFKLEKVCNEVVLDIVSHLLAESFTRKCSECIMKPPIVPKRHAVWQVRAFLLNETKS